MDFRWETRDGYRSSSLEESCTRLLAERPCGPLVSTNPKAIPMELFTVMTLMTEEVQFVQKLQYLGNINMEASVLSAMSFDANIRAAVVYVNSTRTLISWMETKNYFLNSRIGLRKLSVPRESRKEYVDELREFIKLSLHHCTWLCIVRWILVLHNCVDRESYDSLQRLSEELKYEYESSFNDNCYYHYDNYYSKTAAVSGYFDNDVSSLLRIHIYEILGAYMRWLHRQSDRVASGSTDRVENARIYWHTDLSYS